MKNENRGTGIGFVGVLTIVFITLKLTGIIAWNWIWVLSPIWISVILAMLVLGITLLYLTFKKMR